VSVSACFWSWPPPATDARHLRLREPPRAHRAGPPPGNPARRQVTKLIVVMLENHNACAADRGMPHLAARYAKAEQYYAVAHPSLPNYLTTAGGSIFSIRDDRTPAAHPLDGQSVFGQIIAAGKVAQTYAEGTQRNCQQHQGKHDPLRSQAQPLDLLHRTR